MKTFSIDFPTSPHEMAREEIGKQVAFVSREIRNPRFSEDFRQLFFDAPEEEGVRLAAEVKTVALKIERALRSLERKVVFSSAALATPCFCSQVDQTGIDFTGTGQVALSGTPLQLFSYFDRIFTGFGDPWKARPLRTPTLIPSAVLSRCDYFRSFPQNVTFAAHLQEETAIINDFRARHQERDDLDDQAMASMARPEACLSPAVCYHVYHLHQNTTVPATGTVYGICGKCFRYESSNMKDLRRLWDFTMREVVFLGGREEVLADRSRSMDMMAEFLDNHRLAGDIRTASDPFFVAPDAASKTYFQLSAESKFEISLLLRDGERLAVGSHNYHSDFFGRVFSTIVENAGPMHSVCVAFGMERWVYAFMEQHGADPARWPDVMRGAPEFA